METDRRGTDVAEREKREEGACAGNRADAVSFSARELGDGISQVSVFAEERDQRNLGLLNYSGGTGAKSPGGLFDEDPVKEYKLTRDEFEFTKDYLNKEFKKYERTKGGVNALSDPHGEKPKKEFGVPKLSRGEVERLKKSLFNEASDFYGDSAEEREPYEQNYLMRNCEFLQKSNEMLSKIAKERNFHVGDDEIRSLSEYRKQARGGREHAGHRSKDELSLQSFGSYRHRSGSASRSYDERETNRYLSEYEGNRKKYHIEGGVQCEKNFSTSDEEGSASRDANVDDISAYAKNIASLLAGYSNDEKPVRSGDYTETDLSQSRSGNSSTMYHHPMPHSPNLSLRQSSPYPVENTNLQTNERNSQPRHKGYQSNKKSSLRNNSEKSEKNASRDVVGGYAQQREHSSAGLASRDHSSGTLTSRGRLSNRRHQHNSAVTPSSSSNSSISDNNDSYEIEVRGRLNLENDLNGDSPPEPAPPEIPPRGPSLHPGALLSGTAHTLRTARNAAGNDRSIPGQDIYLSQEYIMSGSPRSFPSKPPKSPNSDFATCDRDPDISKENLPGCENRLNPGLIANPPPGVTPAAPLMPSFLPTDQYENISPNSPSRFHFGKRCKNLCSWKCFAIFHIVISLALATLMAYFLIMGTVSSGTGTTTCILLQDAKAVSQNGVESAISSQPPTEESPSTSTHLNILNSPTYTQTPLSSSDSQLVNQQQLQSHQQIHSNNYWPTVTEMFDFDVSYKSRVHPLHFWNLEFKNKQPTFIRLNFTLPWGVNFAVYGRRNVAPTVTQYDFVEFVKGGRIDRLKRHAGDVAAEQQPTRDTGAVHFIPVNDERPKSTGMPAVAENTDVPRWKNVTKRSSVAGDATGTLVVNITLLQYFDTGIWFVSIYNDDVNPHEVSIIIAEAEGVSNSCPNDCTSHGSCYLGKCDCIDGYEGVDCSKSVCPVLCSNHGKYGGGICHCEEGWKGPECDIPNHDCQVPDCSGHGKCVKGTCECSMGWKGPHCSEVDCIDPTCSNHGTCVNGKCYCKAGWQGTNCSSLDKQVYKCLPSCSDHGTYDLETGTCKCQPFWTGSDCSKALCSLDCGPHGRCGQGKCECTDGWTGDRCDLLPCDSRCSLHGQCKNGTCVCSQGWNGKHCTIPGCKNACTRHGMCSLEDGEYRCVCSEKWAGDDCGITLEQECNDEIDNDQDGMTDCSDSECCSHPACSDHIMCLASNDPVEVLLRKQPPSITSSFYQRVKFLIEENSVQSYAHMDEYSESRVSVMRGRVVTSQGLGIVGIRVSVDKDSRFGFTLTRRGGWFDVLVNGGGAVTLQFQRSPFRPLIKTVFVPWNEIVILPPILMSIGETSEESPRNATLPPETESRLGSHFDATISFLQLEPCLDHMDVMPEVISSWAPEKKGPLIGQSGVLSENQVVQESISIPGSELHLLYQTSQAAGFYSLLHMKLTGEEIPETLTHVHVRVEVEGLEYSKSYESDPNLMHIFAWNKRNVYKQRVYGITNAKVSVGYEYSTCANVIWETQIVMIEGYSVDISNIGSWNVDVHHHYNFHEGVLQKGDGTMLLLKNYPRAVKVLMGTGLQRSLKCPDCNGAAKDSKLLTPVALASGPDGSLYVGDFNLIRRITTEGHVYTVYQFSTTQVSYQYYLAISPVDGRLYISNPESHQILRVLILDPVENPALNGEVVVGSGERCIPGDLSNCGDLGPAKLAKLTHPKGLAIAADRTMYIADGTNIRAVDSNDIIHTLIGHHGHNNHWQPIPCKSSISASQAQLQWPTGLALSPLDGSLYFIDDRLVLKLSPDLKIKVVAGSALHCQAKNGTADAVPGFLGSGEDADARGTVLGSLLAIAFSPTGDLYLAQSDSRKVNTIKKVDTAGRISDFAGKSNANEVRSDSCDCKNGSTTVSKELCCEVQNDDSNKETLLSTNAKLYQVSAIAVGPDGVVYIADQGSLHILSLEYYLPVHDENGEFKIPYPATSEMYIFNRYGQHISTRDLTSGKTKYNFLYSKNTSFGKLSTVTDPSGNKVVFLRDYSNVVSTIENTQDHKSELTINPVGLLTKFSQKGKCVIDLEYDGNTGLLLSRSDSTGGGGGETFIYSYDKFGRVTTIIVPTGEIMTLKSTLSDDNKKMVTVSGLNNRVTKLTMIGSDTRKLTIGQDNSKTEIINYRNGSYVVKTSWGGSFGTVAVARFPLLELSLPIEAEMLPMWSHQKSQLSENVNDMEWKYSLVGDINSKTQQTVLRDLYVNHTKILGIELDQQMGKETYVNQEGEKLLTVTYSSMGLPLSWTPQFGHTVNVTYDRFNRLESWTWGNQKETYTYERHGLLSGVTSPQDGTLGFFYNEFNLLSKLAMPSGRVFQFTYDSDGGLRHITLPTGTKHSFSCQPSLGFVRVTYTPPGSTRSYIQHYTNEGALLQTVHPGDGARVVYRYHQSGLLSEIIHGDGKTEISYAETSSNLPNQVLHTERDLEYKWDLTHEGGKLVEERIDFGSKTGLSNAKLSYEYDDNFRVVMIGGRIGGQNLPEVNLEYSPKTGSVVQIGQFKVTHELNETDLFDGTALFARKVNEYHQEKEISVTIHRLEVFRMEFAYDLKGRICQAKTFTRNVGVNSYTNVKNFTWDADGQLVGVEAQEPWGFKYDANGNLLSLNYRGNTIPMEYNVMDRIVKFGEGQYKYDNRGLVIQNAREERFHYSAKGLLVRATKRGRFDVRYFYDHRDRLASRKDNYGNVTQFFYTNQDRPNEVSQIYSPRDGKLMSLVYDDRGHLIYAQVYRHKYYIATDECGTPLMVFNQYGEGIREIMRSPYGHIVYDSNPYLYLPVDFCGGLLDQVTSLVHMANGQVYDPLIGQWMTPNWEGILSRLSSPNHLHLYRFNGNDPINLHMKKSQLTDHSEWLKLLGYDMRSLAPQLFPEEMPGPRINLGPGVGGELVPRGLLKKDTFDKSYKIISGFIATIEEKKSKLADLTSIQKSKVKTNSLLQGWQNLLVAGKPGSVAEPPFGKGIVVSRTDSGMAILSSVSSANPIYKDVFTSVFNRSHMLDLKLLIHGAQQDAFFFVKPETWKASDDRGQLKRLGSQVNTTFHEKDQEMADIKIHNAGTVINLRYGTTPEKEKARLLHHAKGQALRKAWHRERDLLRLGFPGSVEWSQSEIEEILKAGYSMSYEGEYIYDIEAYPELAEDPFNIQFVKKDNYKNPNQRKKRDTFLEPIPLPFTDFMFPVDDSVEAEDETRESLQTTKTKKLPDLLFELEKEMTPEEKRNETVRTTDQTLNLPGSRDPDSDGRKSRMRKCKVWWLYWMDIC